MLFKSKDSPGYTGVEGIVNSHKVRIKGFSITKNFIERIVAFCNTGIEFQYLKQNIVIGLGHSHDEDIG